MTDHLAAIRAAALHTCAVAKYADKKTLKADTALIEAAKSAYAIMAICDEAERDSACYIEQPDVDIDFYHCSWPRSGRRRNGSHTADAVRALLAGYERATDTLKAICDHCSWETDSRECINACCAIRKWRGPCAENRRKEK